MNLSIYAINYTKEGMSQVYDTPSPRKGFFLQLYFFGKKCILKSSRPSLPLKKAPPLISVFSPQGRRGKPPSGARNRCAIRLADHQRSAPCFAGWDRMGEGGGEGA